MANNVNVRDANGNIIAMQTVDNTGGAPAAQTAVHALVDATGVFKVTIGAQHAADEQTVSSGNSLLVNSVGSILGPVLKSDIQRGTGFDGIGGVGIPAGAQQLCVPVSTTFNGAVTLNASAQSVAVASSANFKVGGFALCETGTARQEIVYISAIADATHITAIFTQNHNNAGAIQTFYYNQARDATVGDQVALLGLSAGMTYFYNTNTSLAEYERSADGERDGASGKGTAVAAEYEFNGNPLANGSVLSGLAFDRARNTQGGGKGSGTLSNNPLAANSTTLNLNGAPTTLQPGAMIVLDRAGANPETNYVANSYTPGSTTVALQFATQFSHALNATVEWSQHAPLGPQLNGFLPIGLGLEEEIIYDPVSKQYFVEIAATGDGNSGQNLVIESPGLYNGATFDRARSAPGATGVEAVSSDGVKATYRYAILAIAPVATPTDFLIIQGSGTKTIRVKRIKLTGVATAAGNMPAQLVRRSTAGTLGSAVLNAIAAQKHDINDGAATATVSYVSTANYTTPGTSAGVAGADRLQLSAAGSGIGFTPLTWDFCLRQDKAQILRGAADYLCINLNGAAVPAGGVIDIEVETEEDNS